MEKTWPNGQWRRKGRKACRCDFQFGGGIRCDHVIQSGEMYYDPGESNPENAGGFGGYRYCSIHGEKKS